MAEYEHIVHPFAPIVTPAARVLVLGSLPSKLSRENDFYYGNPRNRFWHVMAAVLDQPVPADIPQKAKLLNEHGIALWDVIAECDIRGSSDASIRNARPVDIARVRDVCPVRRRYFHGLSLVDIARVRDVCRLRTVFANGRTAERLFKHYLAQELPGIPFACLPSTSPANAAWRLPQLERAWTQALAPYLKDPRA